MVRRSDLFLVLPLLERGKFSKECFCPQVRHTGQVLFLQGTAPLLFPVCALRLHSASSPTLVVRSILLCLSTTLALQTTVPSASYRLTHRGFLSLPDSLIVRQCLQKIPVSCLISAIFLTRLETKTFHPFPGLQIQYSATILFIHTFTEVMGHHFNAPTSFFTIFAAICPLTSSSLTIVCFLQFQNVNKLKGKTNATSTESHPVKMKFGTTLPDISRKIQRFVLGYFRWTVT